MTNFNRILAAVDFTETSARALADAAQLAMSLDAQLEVVHVQPGLLTPSVATPAAMPQALPPAAAEQQVEALEVRRKTVSERLERMIAPYRGRVPVTARAELGDPAQKLLEASGSVDMIVLGAHQRNAVQDLLHGSVERKVSKNAKCPVLLVPEVPAVESAGAAQ